MILFTPFNVSILYQTDTFFSNFWKKKPIRLAGFLNCFFSFFTSLFSVISLSFFGFSYCLGMNSLCSYWICFFRASICSYCSWNLSSNSLLISWMALAMMLAMFIWSSPIETWSSFVLISVTLFLSTDSYLSCSLFALATYSTISLPLASICGSGSLYSGFQSLLFFGLLFSIFLLKFEKFFFVF